MDPLKDRTINWTAYALATLGVCIADLQGWQVLGYVCKPLLMVILSSWFFFNSRRVGDRFTLLVQGGLFFSLVGDIALMLQHLDAFNFLIGLGAFFLAQLCYAMAFAHNVFDEGGSEGWLVSVLLAFVVAVYTLFFAWDLVPLLDDGLSLPVIACLSGSGLMAVMAAFRYRRTYPRSFWTVFAGAVLFLASDSILAFDRFRRPLPHAEAIIVLTYAGAQFLIAWGCLRHVLDPDNIRRREALTT